MLALAGYPLGERFKALDPSAVAPAGHLCDLVVAQFDDELALDALAEGCDLVTYEFEQVPAASVRYLQRRVPVHPPDRALEVAQDRLLEKQTFESVGVPVPRFEPVDDIASLRGAAAAVGLPAVLKTRRGGYDGKGQAVLADEDDLVSASTALGGAGLLLEQFVGFDRELSILAARSTSGESAFYPVVENRHADGILRVSRPGHAPPDVEERARRYAGAVMDALSYAGVLAIEFFEVEGMLLANEMAPRVHNSGHWTIEGAATSQFENHLRAITGLPLGPTEPRGHWAMVNLVGEVPDVRPLLRAGAHVHLYDKDPRPGRKLGHVTLVEDDPKVLESKLRTLAAEAHFRPGNPGTRGSTHKNAGGISP